MSSEKSPTLQEDVCCIMRLKQYFLHTERSYCDLIKLLLGGAFAPYTVF